MAAEKLSMRKIREVLRLYLGLGLKKRQIARSCNISHSTVLEYIRRAERAGLGWPLPEGLDDAAIESRLFAPLVISRSCVRPMPEMDYIHRELRRDGVTLQLLWSEYKDKEPAGYQYSQFCERYRRWAGRLDVVLRQEHRAGEKLFVDYAGSTMPVVDRTTGEIMAVQIFVAVLGASSYTYAEATLDQSLPNWISSHIRAFEYFGGTTDILIPDNLKSGVTRTCRYEPDLNPTYHDCAAHYGAAVIPARPYKPRDKAKVESAVLVVTRWIIAALRNRTFFSLSELNEAIGGLLERLNTRKFKKLNTTRRELFETIDKPALKPLPAERYEYAEWKKATVNIDYHIEVEGHYYSVPYQLVCKKVEARLTFRTVEVIYNGRRIATHARSHVRGRFTTIGDHRPKSHQKHLEWTPSRIIRWAEETGPSTAELFKNILSTRPHPEQGFRACLGILRLRKKHSPERLEAACRRAISIRSYSYRSVKSILESCLDRLPLLEEKVALPDITHNNIRGGGYYN